MANDSVSAPRVDVLERLNLQIASHRLEFDGAQRDAALRLDALSDALRAQSPSFFSRLRTHLPWLISAASGAAVRGVYLWGGVGRGKTLLMDLFFASLASDSAVTATRSHFYHFMRDVHRELTGIKQQTQPLELVAERLAARFRVICLDEFFVTDIGDAMLLAGLFDGLFRRGVTLVATSNVAPQNLYKDGLQRQRFLPVIESLEQHVDVIHLDGGVDYRLRQLEKAPTYLYAAHSDACPTMQRTFAALAGGMQGRPEVLTVEGRAIHALRAVTGMAWFEFSELCDGPRSQNDYIELARLYHTLFIANIPGFDRDNENAARRFIMLIDELYDRGVKLVVSAAAAPQQLYRGERLQFEFERAASRLIEMQTQEYLSGRHRP